MREAGRIVACTLDLLARSLAPGLPTKELDRLARSELKALGARPSFLGYLGYPAVICVSVNDEIVHGIPGERVIEEGDLVSVDAGAIVDGFHGDAAVTLIAGDTNRERKALVDATRKALELAIGAAQPGNRVGDISAAVEGYIVPLGYGLVREYVGHGIGRKLHEPPQVPNYGPPGHGPLLRAGMTIAIEPMVNLGDWQTKTLDDEWTVVTLDGSASAHFEHTIAITDAGPEVLTVL